MKFQTHFSAFFQFLNHIFPRKRWGWWGATIFFLVVVIVGFLKLANYSTQKGANGADASFQPPLTLSVDAELFKVVQESTVIYMTFVSKLQPNYVQVSSSVSGYIDSSVDVDADVNANDVCVRLSNVSLLKEEQQARKEYRYAILAQKHATVNDIVVKEEDVKAKLRSAREQLEWLKKEAILAEKLFEKGFTSERDLYQAKLAVKNAENQLTIDATRAEQDIEKTKVDMEDVTVNVVTAKERLADATAKVEALTVRCPIAGKIGMSQVPPKGFKVSEGALLLEIQSKETPSVFNFDITRDYKRHFFVGQKVFFYPTGKQTQQRSGAGEVDSIVVAKSKRSQSSDLDVGNSERFTVRIKPLATTDMQLGAVATIEIPIKYEGIKVASDYVVNNGVNSYVYVQSQAQASIANLQIVIASPFRNGFLISSGIKEGDALLPIPRSLREQAKRSEVLRVRKPGEQFDD